ncbi:protein cueball [Neodiprion pinetum]|uniref:protein cueball n=1 Tax=Neodiprion pinetum TaxID=441929 RepID=UPI001EE11E25|nr:protein cueball [Neodiprion pinetum]
MVSRDTFLLTLALVSGFLVVSMDAQSWDFAVAIRNRIDFYSRNGTLTFNLTVDKDATLKGLAYDYDTQTVYMSDSKNTGVFMYSHKLGDKSPVPSSVLKPEETSISEVVAIVFDPLQKMLYWTDQSLKALMKMKVPSKENPKPTPIRLHNFTDHNPHGIALDICNRYIYWANNDFSKHSIERSKLDGSDRRVIVDTELYQVYGLAVDHEGGKLYWTDDSEGIDYKIERSDLDGNEREILWEGSSQKPAYIAVDKDSVYWTDWTSDAIWKIRKNRNTQDKPVEVVSYKKLHLFLAESVITRENTGNIDCKAISGRQDKLTKNLMLTTPPVEFHNNATTNTPETTQLHLNCRNNSYYDESTSSCRCNEGFIGAYCDTLSPCNNYCIHGNCTLDNKGLPQCQCPSSYAGERCERYICDGYCLNNGSCSVSNAMPLCKCEHSRGPRCEYTTELDELCSRYCMETENTLASINITLCRCGEWNETFSEFSFSAEQPISSAIIMWSLVAVIGTLIIVVGVLSYHIHKLRRRPRIRKRFVGGKRGITQLTSRPQGPTDSYEISIENCCNMNICETPCFEPKLRTTPTKSKSTKKDEKNSLLDSMEGADSC